MRKVLYLAGMLFLAVLAAGLFWAVRPEGRINQGRLHGMENRKAALVRLEDVSPGVYDSADKLEKLKAIADYLHSEGVPFHVSVIPVYKDPRKNVEISIGDENSPQARAFVETIKYMREKGGIIGLHGYTHQYLYDITGSGNEFTDKGMLLYSKPAYAEERVKKALELMDEAGIPVDYWETPHYTASSEQYRVFGNYFGLLYEPNPKDKNYKNVSMWEGAGPDGRGVIFVPAPLLNVTAEKDVDRIFRQLDKNDPEMLASFFIHPFQEFRFIYKMKAPEGYEFYVYETGSYLHRLVEGIRERGYRFVTVNELIGFLPAQQVTGLPPAGGRVLLAGDFDGDRRSDFLAGDAAAGSWQVIKSSVVQGVPRNRPDSFGAPEEWLTGWGNAGRAGYAAGDFNGDGRDDLAFSDGETGDVRVALSGGSGFAPQESPWGRTGAAGGAVNLLAGDFDGDLKDDLLFWDGGKNTAYVMQSDGRSFLPAVPWLEKWQEGGSLTALAGDFNGDGKSDLALHEGASGTVQVVLSDGRKFVPADSPGPVWLNGFAAGSGWQMAASDFNGDGLTDLAAFDGTAGKWEFAAAMGGKFIPESRAVACGKVPEGRILTGDFNGDGRFDLAVERRFAKGLAYYDVFLFVASK
ncbi:MAG: DUF2334 domain-containing protein [Pelotomaculum sp.]|nr:DUF2334 domain-containing protein [Pelotomaculum sp.]